ncbi:MAG: type VI secretion system contractile sheath large subunit [Gammaproteobacteria bacterium]|jgi:type VI secretion system protein ImpC|nr:type VI secretion system contractile sheath large subunit [Gammaproteobacteria bacterium]
MSDRENKQVEESTATEASSFSLLDEVMQETTMRPEDGAYQLARRGVEAFIRGMLEPSRAEEKVHKRLVDEMITELDAKISAQVDEVLHHEKFQQLESAWRSLRFLVDRTNFRENIKLELVSVSREDLQEDFEEAPEITQSGLYKHVYTAEYGQFGGQPVAAMIGNYEFGAEPQDVALMQQLASVAAMSHAPFIASAAAQFFGVDSIEQLADLKDIKSIFEGPQYTKWRSFRETEDARYVGLAMPRFLLRLPYGAETNPVKAFHYEESIEKEHERYCWGSAAFAFATRLTESFADFRWCPNIIGPQSGGAVEDLLLHQYESMGQIETKIPTEVLISDRKEFELAEEGFIPLTFRKGSDNAAFFSANSIQKSKFFGTDKEAKVAETNYKLGTQLPYMFIINRLGHYIKVIQRENIGSWKERGDLETELNKWIRQYVSDQENPGSEVRSRRPLREAQIFVEDVEGDPGWYRVRMAVRPHFKYMGAEFTLSLVGKLDKT